MHPSCLTLISLQSTTQCNRSNTPFEIIHANQYNYTTIYGNQKYLSVLGELRLHLGVGFAEAYTTQSHC